MINRMMARLFMVAALGQPRDGKFPTIAGEHVYDTAISDIQQFRGQNNIPVLIVYTDSDTNEGESLTNPNAVTRQVEFIIEISIMTWGHHESPDPTDPNTVIKQEGLARCETTAELEFALDLFEAQVWMWLNHPTDPIVAAMRKRVYQPSSWSSIPFRDDDGNNRLATRRLQMQSRINPECVPGVAIDDFKYEICKSIQHVPYLSDAMEEWSDPDAPYYPLIDLLSQVNAGGPKFPAGRLSTVAIDVDHIDPAADPNRLAEGVTQGPDGRVELKAVFKLQ